MDVIEPVIFGECRQFRGRCGCLIGNSPVLEFLEVTISFEMSRGRSIAVAAAMLRAAGFGVMGAVAGVTFSLVDGGKGRSYWESVRPGSWGWFNWGRSRWSRFATTGPSVDLSSAPGYMVVLVGESAVWTVPFSWFGSRCESGECWFRLDRVGRSSR